MICGTLILAGSLLALQKPADNAAPSAATERVTLRDGTVVLGLVTAASTGPRGAVELLVRRDWAESHVKTWAAKWSRAIETGSRLATRQRRERLKAWKGERAASAPADDRIVAWIDQELKQLDDPAHTAPRRSCPSISPGVMSGAWCGNLRRTPGCSSSDGSADCARSKQCRWTT